MRERPLFLKTFTTFAAMLLVIAFVIGAVFNYSLINYSEDEISKASIGKLRVIYTINDLLIESVNREALRLSIDGYLNTMYSGLEGTQSMNNMDWTVNIRSIITVLDQVVSANDTISSVYVYMEDADLIISSNLGIDNTANFDDTGWLKQYNENKENGVKASWVTTRVPINEKVFNDEFKMSVLKLNRENVISYIFPLSTYTTPLNGAIIININESKFSNLINRKNNDEGTIFIIDSKGNVITNSDKKIVGGNISEVGYVSKILDSTAREGYVIADIDNNKQLITYYKSEYNDWIYIGEYPLEPLMNKATSLRIQIIFYIGIMVLLGFVVAYFTSKRIYNPVQSLIQNIRSYKALDDLESKNEVTVLTKAFDTLIKQEKNLNNLLEKNKGNMKNKYLIDMINGVEFTPEELEMVGVQFIYPFFICAVIGIDKYKLFLSRFSGEQAQYMKAIIINICEDILNKDFKCYEATLEKEKILLVINLPEDNLEANREKLIEGLKYIQEEIAKIMDNTITIGIGSDYTGLGNAKLSYAEAIEALEMKLIKGTSQIIGYEHINSDMQEIYQYPVNQEKLIFNYLSNGSNEEIARAVRGLVTDIREKEGINSDNTRLIFNQLVGKIMEYLLKHNFSMTNVFGENYNIFHQLSTKETIDEIEVWLIDIFSKIISYSENRKACDKKHINKVLEYIHNNYKKDIDVNTMAQEIGISYSQLRRVFVEELGVNLISYVNNLRINEAKRVLLETDRSIYEIALSLGYNNDQSFNRFFKKFEGVTPGEFRNINKNL